MVPDGVLPNCRTKSGTSWAGWRPVRQFCLGLGWRLRWPLRSRWLEADIFFNRQGQFRNLLVPRRRCRHGRKPVPICPVALPTAGAGHPNPPKVHGLSFFWFNSSAEALSRRESGMRVRSDPHRPLPSAALSRSAEHDVNGAAHVWGDVSSSWVHITT
jgi:hypothetical protein